MHQHQKLLKMCDYGYDNNYDVREDESLKLKKEESEYSENKTFHADLKHFESSSHPSTDTKDVKPFDQNMSELIEDYGGRNSNLMLRGFATLPCTVPNLPTRIYQHEQQKLSFDVLKKFKRYVTPFKCQYCSCFVRSKARLQEHEYLTGVYILA